MSIAAIVLPIALTGCVAGPDFQPPEAPIVGSYTVERLPERTAEAPGTGGASQRFATGREIPGEWWTLFRSETIDRLIRLALAENPTLALAQARIVEAQENRRAQFGTLFPSADASLSANREKGSSALSGQASGNSSPFTLMNGTLNVSYNLDLSGATRRQLEALDAEVEFQQFQREGAYLTLTATIVTTAVNEASLRAQIRTIQEIVALQQEQLALVERRLELGGATFADVLIQRTQLAQTRAALPPLEKALDQARHQLAVLIGKTPGEAVLPAFELESLHLPVELPVSLPSSLARQRPDVRAAEALLHAASARVGVATANLYPQVTLTGAFGSTAATAGGLFESGSTFWNVGAGLLQPLFRGGTLSAQKRAAVAVYDQAAAQYRETVLAAFQTVADVLRALDADAQTLQARAEGEAIAENSLELARKQFQLGAVGYLTLLSAQQQYREARIGVIVARTARFADTAALFQALGGGWWNRPQDPTARRNAEG